MIIGVPKEIKLQEHRIGLTPESVKALVERNHEVLVENNGGFEAGFTNEDYLKAGAKIIKTSEEIFKLLNQNSDKQSIHLENFIKIPSNWFNENIEHKWDNIKKIRDEANISIETKRASKEIGSSLEAKILIKLNKDLYNITKNENFSEICITSESKIVEDQNTDKEVEVVTEKAEGSKCSLC